MMFESVSHYFANLQHVKRGKTCVSGLHALFHGTEVAKMVSQWNQLFNPIRPETMFESVSEHFANRQHVKRGKTCVSSLKALFREPKLRKWFRNKINHSNPIRPQTMFESFSKHFANRRHVKRGKTFVSGRNVLFRGSKVAKMVSQRNQPFYRIRAQMMFESVSEHFTSLLHIKRGKT